MIKVLLGLVVIAIIAGVVLSPVISSLETQAEHARADRIAQEARLEQARAATTQAQADAFGVRMVALLPWGLLIVAVMFVGALLVLVAFRPQQHVGTLGQLPPQIGQRPMYFVQGPHETPDAFMMRVSMQVRQLEAPDQTTR